ncbi:cGMP-dependent protein kinase 2 [Folsomia candida]|uniref:cGMP-dependent protein kinase n=1 Tax=Folsomia candida TaxID=158441 RepID=A0A226DF60_FOLCA|nr:cGMP-dependent protein kinase 2 [Folsomia candida]
MERVEDWKSVEEKRRKREGEVGSHLYVSAEGTFYVSQDTRTLGTLKSGVAFGELALLYNCKRTASVRAITECKVWALERRAFRVAMVKAGMQRIKDRLAFLKSVPLLKGLDAGSLGRVADCLEVERYPQGSFIIREGAAGDTFFIISEGRVQVTTSSDMSDETGNDPATFFGNHPAKNSSWLQEPQIQIPTVNVESYENSSSPFQRSELLPQPQPVASTNGKQTASVSPWQVLRELGHGDYFGEQALLHEERRSANVIAITDVEVLTLDRESFMQLIGDLTEFNLNRRPLQSSSCSELNMLANSESNRTWTTHDRFDEVGCSKKQLSCSLPNPILDRERCLKHDDYDFSKLRLDDLEFVATLGVGGFGRVELVQISYDPNRVFALKCLPKAHISATQQQEHVFSERNIMLSCKCPFIGRMYRTFKDTKYVYMLMEACLGGEVWTVLRDKGSFDETSTRFIAACVILALEYLHERSVIYRDLKPENLMLANDGYVKLVDFGFSKVVSATSKTWTFCGTPEYCAPEVILNKGHDHSVDFWAFGILLFELLTGCPPWGPMAENCSGSDQNSDPLVTYNAILKGIESVHFTKSVSKGAISLIRRLCRQVPGERLGVRNFREINSHRWWQGFDWEGVRHRRMKPPIRPNLRAPADTSNFDKFELEIQDVPDDFSGWDMEF